MEHGWIVRLDPDSALLFYAAAPVRVYGNNSNSTESKSNRTKKITSSHGTQVLHSNPSSRRFGYLEPALFLKRLSVLFGTLKCSVRQTPLPVLCIIYGVSSRVVMLFDFPFRESLRFVEAVAEHYYGRHRNITVLSSAIAVWILFCTLRRVFGWMFTHIFSNFKFV